MGVVFRNVVIELGLDFGSNFFSAQALQFGEFTELNIVTERMEGHFNYK